MLRVLANPTFRAVYLAQVISLVGAGVATVALGLMAYEIAGAGAGAVVGIALALKTLTTVGLSSFITALETQVLITATGAERLDTFPWEDCVNSAGCGARDRHPCPN